MTTEELLEAGRLLIHDLGRVDGAKQLLSHLECDDEGVHREAKRIAVELEALKDRIDAALDQIREQMKGMP